MNVFSDYLNFLAFKEKLPLIGRLLGLDVGTHKIGLALSDPTRTFVRTLDLYRRKTSTLDATFIMNRIQDYQVVGVIIGMPYGTEHKENTKALGGVKSLLEGLEALRITTPLCLCDESFSTQMGRIHLQKSGFRVKKLAKTLDSAAAMVVLEEVLDLLRFN